MGPGEIVEALPLMELWANRALKDSASRNAPRVANPAGKVPDLVLESTDSPIRQRGAELLFVCGPDRQP
jgi:hypothetical protein